jgi:hypothetical protein
MEFLEAKAKADALWKAHEDAAAPLDRFARGPMGLTPDAVRSSPEWKAAYAAERKAFAELRAYNAWYVKAFKKERIAARTAQREALSKNSLT